MTDGGALLPLEPPARRWTSRVARLDKMRPDLRFAFAAIIALGLVVVTYWLFVATETGQRLENLALRGAELRTTADREAGVERLTQVSIAIFGVALAAVVAVAWLRRRAGLGLLTAGLMGASVVAVEALKDILTRPALVDGPDWILRNSFPSGSAAVAAAMAVGALLVSPDRLRWAVLPIGAIYATIIGDAIQTTGWHRLSDTIGGVLIVIGTACGALGILARGGLVQPSTHGRIDWRIRRALVGLAGAALLLGSIVLVTVAVFPLLVAPSGSRQAVLQTAFPLFGSGFILLAVLGFGWLVEPFTLGRRSRPESESSSSGPGPPADQAAAGAG